MVPCGPFFLSTKPPNWLCHVRNRQQSFDIDTSREMLQWFCHASQEEWSCFTEAAICSQHKKNNGHKADAVRQKKKDGQCAGLHTHWICLLARMHKWKSKPGDSVTLWEERKGFSDYTLNRMADPELGLRGWRGGGDVRLQIRRWGSGGIKHVV